MNSGFSDFQDLLNITTSGEEIQSVIDDLKQLEEEVDDNKTNIATNTTAISNNTTAINNNTTAISNNGVLINNNTSNITTNTSNIATNTSNINTNSTSIASLNNEVLKKDGSVQLDFGYTPSNNQDIATKTYVDTHSTSTSYLRVDGSNSMTGDLDLDSNDLKLNSVNSLSATGNNTQLNVHSDFSLLTFGNISLIIGSSILGLNRTLNMNNNNIINSGTINGYDLSTFSSDISTNATNIATNASDITTLETDKLDRSGGSLLSALDCGNHNLSNVFRIESSQVISKVDTSLPFMYVKTVAPSTYLYNIMINFPDETKVEIWKPLDMKTNNISNAGTINGYTLSTFSSDITTNQNDISTNTSNISTNASDILDRLRIDGSDTMTGNLDLGTNNIFNVNRIDTDRQIVIDNSSQGQNYIQWAGNFSTSNENKMGYQLSFGGGLEIWGTGSSPNRILRIRDILNCDTINGASSTEMSYLIGATSNIQTQITTNLNNINSNYGLIITNQNDISTNASNISTNTNNITTKVSKSGDTMTGDLNIGNNSLVFSSIGSYIPQIFSDSGQIRIVHPSGFSYGPNTTQKNYEFPLSISASAPCSLGNHVFVSYSLTVNDDTQLNGGLKVVGDYGDMMGSGGVVGQNFYGRKQIWLKNTTSGGQAGWFIGNQGDSTTTSNDNDLYFQVQYYNGTQRLSAYIQDATTNVRMNFTGQHRSMPDFKYSEDKIGLIVEATGKYMNLITEGEECSQITCITINDSIPVVALCNEEKSKKVFGVISNEEEKTRTYNAGNFGSFYDKVEGDHRLYINSIGEGAIWICNKNGNLQNGDYICSAGINGYGMRQDEEFLANYTVAKITMDCDFNPQLEEVKIWENGGWTYTGDYKPQYECITLDDGLKIAFVGCTYHCG